jgi:hypothetical protein
VAGAAGTTSISRRTRRRPTSTRAARIPAPSLPEGATLKPNSRGATITIGNPNDLVGITLGVSHKACSYKVQVEVAYP